MAALGVLKQYAKTSIPSPSLPSSILFAHTETTLTIFDAYPKAMFHFLIMPRLLASMETAKYHNLRTLLQWDRAKAKETILQLQEDAKQVVADIEEEMVRLHGFKWKIWLGFHAVPSMDHLHMHIISSDLCSPSLKNKKHYNSFHPKAGFFLHLDEVLEWFEGDDSYYTTMSQLSASRYEPLLKADLKCWKCSASQKNIPTLKAHLQEEWNKEKRKAVSQKKHKREEEAASSTLDDANAEDNRQKKRQETLDDTPTPAV